MISLDFGPNSVEMLNAVCWPPSVRVRELRSASSEPGSEMDLSTAVQNSLYSLQVLRIHRLQVTPE